MKCKTLMKRNRGEKRKMKEGYHHTITRFSFEMYKPKIQRWMGAQWRNRKGGKYERNRQKKEKVNAERDFGC